MLAPCPECQRLKMKGHMLSDKAQLIVAKAVAKAVASSKKFNQAEHKAAMEEITKAVMADTSLMTEMPEMIGKIANVSATSQDLAKAGVVQHGDASAFAQAVRKELDTIKAEVEKETARLAKKGAQ